MSKWSLAFLAALAASLQSCTGCGTPSVSVTPVPTVGPTEDHQVRCGCQLGWDALTCSSAGSFGIPAGICTPNPRSFNIDLCVPADLNTALGATPTDAEFTAGVKGFCEMRVKDTVSAFIGAIASDQGCGHFTLVCEPVAIGSSGVAVAMNPRCDKPCADVPCVTSGAGANCDLNTVFGAPSGFDPTACSCTQTSGCGITTSAVCQPMNTVVDPPDIRTGVLTEALSQPSTVAIDPVGSSLTATVNVEACDPTGTICASFSDTRTTAAHGTLKLYGRPCPGAACDLRIGFTAYPDDLTFEFGCIGPVCLGSAHLSQMSIVGGTGDIAFSVDAAGHGTIPAGAVQFVADGVRDGSRFKIASTNPQGIPVAVDFAAKTFSFPGGVTLSLSGGSTATLALVGTIDNQPPRAVVGPDQVLECSSPQGALAHLDASGTSDPDGNQIATNWWRDAAFTLSALISHETVTDAVAPLGTTRFAFTVSDSSLATDGAATDVTVRDTSPPVLQVIVEPTCLWPPDHRMVLFRLGDGLQASATDACDPSPFVRIISVTSDQPLLGKGSGHSAPDVEYGSGAFCVRAERTGTQKQDRTYTVTVEARDASGNTTTRAVPIRVPHDLGPRGRSACPNVDPARVVPDGDPRCREDVAPPNEDRAAVETSAVATDDARSAAPSAYGCNSAGAGSLAALGLLLVFPRHRRWKRALGPLS